MRRVVASLVLVAGMLLGVPAPAQASSGEEVAVCTLGTPYKTDPRVHIWVSWIVNPDNHVISDVTRVFLTRTANVQYWSALVSWRRWDGVVVTQTSTGTKGENEAYRREENVNHQSVRGRVRANGELRMNNGNDYGFSCLLRIRD